MALGIPQRQVKTKKICLKAESEHPQVQFVAAVSLRAGQQLPWPLRAEVGQDNPAPYRLANFQEFCETHHTCSSELHCGLGRHPS